MKASKLWVSSALAATLSVFSAFVFSAPTAPDAKLTNEIIQSLQKQGGTVFPIGKSNDAYAKYFTGDTYLAPLSGKDVNVSNVTFAPKVINHWHKHKGSCQVLVGVSGRGYYQIWGEPAKELKPGESMVIPEGVKHWHGASKDGWFQHLSIMKEGAGTEWLEPVDPKEYEALK